ncbi:MAG: sigma 54-interacting transcriptional regulator [Betaproteobacteria bacterium]
MSTPVQEGISERLLDRIYIEFLEMPGLHLTRRQAQRLWGLDEQTCLQVLDYLVETKFLCRDGETYKRAVRGAADNAEARMAGARREHPADDRVRRLEPAYERIMHRLADRRAADLRVAAEPRLEPATSSIPLGEDDIRLAARVDVPALITARSRRDRETCARLIHVNGARGRGPFVTFFDDGARAHVEHSSAFRGRECRCDVAILRHRFEQADGGTLFVDDVATFASDAQTALLRLLDARASTAADRHARADRHDVRIIAGASRSLDAERAAGTFREVLFYRLNIIHVARTN